MYILLTCGISTGGEDIFFFLLLLYKHLHKKLKEINNKNFWYFTSSSLRSLDGCDYNFCPPFFFCCLMLIMLSAERVTEYYLTHLNYCFCFFTFDITSGMLKRDVEEAETFVRYKLLILSFFLKGKNKQQQTNG